MGLQMKAKITETLTSNLEKHQKPKNRSEFPKKKTCIRSAVIYQALNEESGSLVCQSVLWNDHEIKIWNIKSQALQPNLSL